MSAPGAARPAVDEHGRLLASPWVVPPPAPPGWRERWTRWRQARLADAGFRRWAAGFPLTRFLARRHAADLFDLVAGFVHAQVLLACLRLGLLDRLRDGPRTTGALARALDLQPRTLERLLMAAAGLGLVVRVDPITWRLGDRGAMLLGLPALTALVEHHGAFYADLADPVALLRAEPGQTRLAAFWTYRDPETGATPDASRTAAYSALMAASQPLVAEQLLDAVALGGHRVLMDVGGGEGAFLLQVAARAPGLQLMLCDLPAVAERARARLAATDAAPRTQVHGVDFLRQPLPRGADVVTLVRVLHDHDDPDALRLLTAVRLSLPAGGRLLVVEPMAGTPGAGGVDCYFAAYFLCMGRGRLRTPAEMALLLHAAGFGEPREYPTRQPLQARVLSAVALDGQLPGG